MKQVSFRRLRAEHFKCYSDFTFDFERFGAGCHSIRGVNKVTPRLGSNGAGKSTLWDALCFALFGKTAKRLRSIDVVPYGSKDNPKVTLTFNVDNATHRIERSAWPHSLRMDGATATQEHIEQLIGVDLDQFLHCVILAQGQPLFLDLPPRDKLQLLSDVLNLNRFEDYSAQAKQHVSQIAVEDHTLQIVRSTLEGQLSEVETTIDDLMRQSEQFEQQRTRQILGLQTQLAAAEAQLGKASTAREGAKIDSDAIRLQLDEAHGDMIAAQVQHNNGKNLRMQAARMTVGSSCSQCGQPVTAEARARIAGQAEQLIQSSGYEAAKAKHGTIAAIYHQAFAAHEHSIDDEQRAADALNATRVALQLASAAVDPRREQLAKLAKRRLQLQEKAQVTDARRDALEAARQTIEPWIEGFRNIRLMVLDDVLATLGMLTTSYANELGLPCDVKFAIERTTKTGSVVSGVTMSVDAVEKLEAWSGGEAQRLRLAASLALSAALLVEAGLSFDLLALDEPSAHLSSEGLNELTGFLGSHAEAEGRRIFLTDQRRLAVDSTVTLTRESGNVSLA